MGKENEEGIGGKGGGRERQRRGEIERKGRRKVGKELEKRGKGERKIRKK